MLFIASPTIVNMLMSCDMSQYNKFMESLIGIPETGGGGATTSLFTIKAAEILTNYSGLILNPEI